MKKITLEESEWNDVLVYLSILRDEYREDAKYEDSIHITDIRLKIKKQIEA